jgi:hypothetical protein
MRGFEKEDMERGLSQADLGPSKQVLTCSAHSVPNTILCIIVCGFFQLK